MPKDRRAISKVPLRRLLLWLQVSAGGAAFGLHRAPAEPSRHNVMDFTLGEDAHSERRTGRTLRPEKRWPILVLVSASFELKPRRHALSVLPE